MSRQQFKKFAIFFLLFASTCSISNQAAFAQTEIVPERNINRLDPENIYQQTVLGTVWIVSPNSTSSGWILDKEKGYIVTNYHCVDTAETHLVYFPKYEEGQLITDYETYSKYTKPTKAIVLDCDTHHDLAILKVEKIPSRCRQLPIADKSAKPGQRLHAIGGRPKGSSGMFIYASGNVRQVAKGPNAIGKTSRMLEMTVATNPGNSGGPIVNDFGQIVGVHEAGARDVRNVTLAVDVEQLHRYLQTVSTIYPPATSEQNFTALQRHYTSRHLNNAIFYGNQTIRLNPKHGKAYAMRGWSHYLKRDYVAAKSDFSSSIELDSGIDESFRGLALCQSAMGDYSNALKNYNKSLKLNPNNKWAHYGRGNIFIRQRKYDLAIKELNAAIKNNPTESLVYISRGQAYVSTNQLAKAEKDFYQAAKINPSSWSAMFELGTCLLRQEKYNLAEPALFEALALDPRPFETHYNIALLLLNTNRFDDAVVFATNSIKRNPGSSDCYSLRADIQSARKNYRSAQADLDQAISINGKVARYYYQRHSLLKTLGQDSKAENALATARSLDGTRHTVAKPTTNSNDNTKYFDGLWTYEGTFKGIQYNCAIQFAGNQFGYSVQYRQTSGQIVHLEDNGYYKINSNGTLTLDKNQHKFEFKKGRLYLTFPHLNIAFPMKRSGK